MPPKTNNDGVNRTRFHQHQPDLKKEKASEPPRQQPVEKFSILSRQSDVRLFGSQQRERLEHLLAAGVGGQATFGDAYKANAFRQADKAYLAIVGDESIKLTDATKLGLAKYEEVLKSYKVNPLESRRPNLSGALDFLKAEANRTGGLSAPDPTALRSLERNGGQPQVFIRMLSGKDEHLNSPDARLGYFNSAKNEGKIVAWSSRPEGLHGSGLDYQETMRRFGWTNEQIAGADVKDSKFIVYTAEAAVDPQRPTNEVITSKAKGDAKGFGDFNAEPKSFWKQVTSYGYEGKLSEAKKLGFDYDSMGKFARILPPDEAKVFEARHQMDRRMGVNPLFSGDGMTKRPDGINGKIGVPEFITDNTAGDATLREMAKKGQVAFLDMRDMGFLDDYKQQLADHRTKTGDPKATLPLLEIPVKTTSEAAGLPRITEGAILRSEMKGGAKAGGALGAVTSLGEVYDRVKTGDYTGAATTLAVNTGAGATIGGLSAGGERIVGRGIENALSRSNLANKGLERLYTSPAARSFVGRLAQTEGSAITSQTFNATLRTVGGRIGGAGVIGGVVNGAFSAYDQIGAYKRGEVSASQAIGTVTGEAAVGLGAGMAGAAFGATIGSIIPGAGTLVGGVIGFGVGMAAGYVSDKILRGMGVDKAIAKGVTATIDAGARFAGAVQKSAGQAVQAGRQFVGQQVQQARAVYNSASSAVSSARTFVAQRANQARAAISSGTRAAVNYVSQAGTRAVAAVRNTASQAVSHVRSTVNNVANQVSSTVSNVASQARATVSNAVNSVASGAVSNLRSVFGW